MCNPKKLVYLASIAVFMAFIIGNGALANEILFSSNDIIRVFSVSDDGRLVAYCGTGIHFEIYDRKTKGRFFFADAHSDLVECLAFSPAAKLVVSGSLNGEIKVWSLLNKKPLASTKLDDAIRDVAFVNESTIGFSVIGRSMRVLQLDDTKGVTRLIEKNKIPERKSGCRAFFPGGAKYVITSSILFCEPDSKPGNVRIYDTETNKLTAEVYLGHTEFSSICFIDEHRFVLGDQAGQVFIVDLLDRSFRKTRIGGDVVSSLTFARGPNKIVAATYSGKLVQVDPKTLERSLIGKHGYPTNYIYWLKKEERVISGGYDKQFRVFELFEPDVWSR